MGVAHCALLLLAKLPSMSATLLSIAFRTGVFLQHASFLESAANKRFPIFAKFSGNNKTSLIVHVTLLG